MAYIEPGGNGAGGPTGGGVLYYDPCSGKYISKPPTPCPPAGPQPPPPGNTSPWQWDAAVNWPFLGPLNPVNLDTPNFTLTVGDLVIGVVILFIILLIVGLVV